MIYEPCEGKTPTISLNKGNLHIKEDGFIINDFELTTNNNALTITVYAGNSEEISSIYAEIINPENGLVLWKIGNEKLIMTPIENSDKFRHIKNNCPDYKRNELEFEEPNY